MKTFCNRCCGRRSEAPLLDSAPVSPDLNTLQQPNVRQTAERECRVSVEVPEVSSSHGGDEGSRQSTERVPAEESAPHAPSSERQWPQVNYAASTPLRWAWADPLRPNQVMSAAPHREDARPSGIAIHVRGFAMVNPFRWSHPRRSPGDLANVLSKEIDMDRPVILRPGEDHSSSGRDVTFENVQSAIEWLRIRAQAAEQASAA
eukprot:TRINITY_DN110992_c0_g1_i1.p1 TRINITY_DN110992_c0_g1~~TRINITY_DN110992_c0_g1_i1.p1  ORF type:complete len:204 (-),score=21.39 TRINITY_DN110992_c0_g1_i1:73-684(-)